MGKLIVLEGMDGSGTTTQSALLVSHLKSLGYRVLSSAEPTRSFLGQEIRKWLAEPIEKEPYLLTMLALCFAADRMHHIHFTLAPGLKTHDFVVVDRYVLSSLVYQGLHLPSSFVAEINQFALKPDMTIVLEIPAKEAYERISTRAGAKDFYESMPLLEMLGQRYIQLAKRDLKQCAIVDGTGCRQQVHNHVVSVVNEAILKQGSPCHG